MIDPIQVSIPTIGQRQHAAKAMVAQGLQQLAMQIYGEMASKFLKDRAIGSADPALLQQIAKDALIAAQCYFSGLGIAQFNQDQQHGQA